MKKYLLILKNSLQTRIAYRIDAIAFLFSELLSWGVLSYVWMSVYHSGSSLGKYSLSALIMYYILSKLNKLIIFPYNTAWIVGDDIRLGRLTTYLVSPIKLVWRHLAISAGASLSRIIMFLPIFFLLLYLLFEDFKPSLFQMIYYLMVLLIGFLIHFLFFYIIGVSTFYVGYVQGINFVIFEVVAFLSGNIIPIDLMPGWLGMIVINLPFKYISFIPINALTTEYNGIQGLQSLVIGILWIIILYVIGDIIYKNGIKKYEAYGS